VRPIQKSGGPHMINNQYETKTYQIELLTEFSMSVYNRLLRYVQKNDIDLENKDLMISLLFRQLEDTLSLNLFKKDLREIKTIQQYWEHMNHLTKELTGSN